MRESGDEPSANGIGNSHDDNGYCRRRSLGAHGSLRDERNNYVHVQTNKLCGQFGEAIEIPVRPSVLEPNVASFDISEFAQAFVEPINVACGGSLGTEKTNHRHRTLLRTRRNGPCRRAAKQGDEAAPFQLIEFHQGTTVREARSIPEVGDQVRTCAVQDFGWAVVRCGSKREAISFGIMSAPTS